MDVSLIVATFEGCNPEQINDPAFFERLLEESSRAGDFTVLHTCVHSFKPQGQTGVAVLAESHIAFHSWPESGTLFVDIGTCSGAQATEAAFKRISELVDHQRVIPHSITCHSKPTKYYSPLMPPSDPLNKSLPC